MSKIDDVMVGRMQGMEFALKIAKEQGIDFLEKEVRSRAKTGINLNMTHKEIDKAIKAAKMQVLDTVLVMSCLVLRDEFDFGKQRLNRFKERFDSKTECLMDDNATWDDFLYVLKDEVNMNLSIRLNDKDVRIREK